MGNDSRRLLLGFGAASLGATLIGAVICALADVPAGLWARNLAAWVVGCGLALALARTTIARLAPGIPWLAVAALAATFLAAGQDGVHRWVQLGPVNANAAMIVLPAALVALAVGPPTLASAWLPALAALALLVAQPDASQATAFGLPLALIAWARAPRPLKAPVTVAALALAGGSWLRPDPLPPVPEVEDILELAASHAPLLAGAALILLAAVAVAPFACVRRPDARLAAAALSLGLALGVTTTFLGAYPVPLVGIGLSPILGAWLGVGLLAGHARGAATAQ